MSFDYLLNLLWVQNNFYILHNDTISFDNDKRYFKLSYCLARREL